jgi:hypothetical protein
MKRTLFAVFCVLTSIAYAETWQESYDNGEGVIEYVDVDSIQRDNNRVSVSVKRDYDDGTPRRDTDDNDAWFVYSETRSEKTIDCDASKITINRLVNLSDDGTQQSVVKSYSAARISETNEWDMGVKEIVCAGVKAAHSLDMASLGIGNKTVMPQHYPNREVMPEENDIEAWYQKFGSS